MAVINRYTLVLNGVNVVRDVVTGTMGFGGNLARVQTPASPFSTRLTSQGYPQAEQQNGLRHDHAPRGMDDAADWAGRPGCLGVLASRSPAYDAGWITPSRWSLAMGGACPTAAWRFGRFTAKPRASVGEVPLGQRLPLRVQGLKSSRLARLLVKQAENHARAARAGRKPAGGALPASTRG